MAGLLDGLFGGALGGGGGGSGILGALTDWNSLSPTIGGMFSNNQNALLGLGLGLMSGDPRMAMQGAMLGRTSDTQAAKQRREEEERKRQASAIAGYGGRMGWDPALIELAQSNPNLASSAVSASLKKQLGGGEEERFGLNPQYGVDAQGNPVLLQMGTGGTVKQATLPEGVSLSREPIRLDAGTHFVLLDPITRQPIGQVAKDLAGAEQQKVLGKATGEAQADLGGTMSKAQESLALINKLRTHPGRQLATGKTSFMGAMPGTEAYDFSRLNDQVAGRAFLEAFESLKGGGQITEVEGRKATEAIARLDRAQTEEGYMQALKDLEEVITAGMNRARQRAGQPAQSQQIGGDGWTDMGGGVRIRRKQ